PLLRRERGESLCASVGHGVILRPGRNPRASAGGRILLYQKRQACETATENDDSHSSLASGPRKPGPGDDSPGRGAAPRRGLGGIPDGNGIRPRGERTRRDGGAEGFRREGPAGDESAH